MWNTTELHPKHYRLINNKFRKAAKGNSKLLGLINKAATQLVNKRREEGLSFEDIFDYRQTLAYTINQLRRTN